MSLISETGTTLSHQRSFELFCDEELSKPVSSLKSDLKDGLSAGDQIICLSPDVSIRHICMGRFGADRCQ